MYKLKKTDLISKHKYPSNKEYLIDFFKKIHTQEEGEYFLLPDIIFTPLKDANLSHDIYNYFQLVWAIEERGINIEDVVGSHDWRNLELKTWFKNFLIHDVGPETLNRYLTNQQDLFTERPNHLQAFDINGKYYVADGHHRFSALFLHYHILASQGLLPADFPKTIKSLVKVVPRNIDFVKRFNEFCIAHHLYYEDEIGVLPEFQIVDSNPDNPTIRYGDTDIVFDSNTDLTTILPKIEETKKRKK